MKNIKILSFFLFSVIACQAQSPIISMVDYENKNNLELTENYYLKDVESKFAPFVGTWKWTQSNSELTIIIEKLEMVYDPHLNIYSDELVGKYKYVENGNEIINTLNYIVTVNTMWNGAYVPFYDTGYYSNTEIRFSFNDYEKEKRGNAKMKLINVLNNPDGSIIVNQAKWSLWEEERLIINGQPVIQPGFSIPTEVTLTKQ